MKKIGLILDSSSSFSKEELELRGVGFIPLMVTINGEDFRAGIDINSDEIYKRIIAEPNIVIRTSSPEPKSIIESFDKALEENDEVIYIGISKKLSSTVNLAQRIVKSDEKYLNKVHILDSIYSSPWSGLIIDDFFQIVSKTDNMELIIKILKEHQETLIGWAMPGDISFFYKGGRITKTQYIIGKMVRIQPVITNFGGALESNEIIKTTSVEKGMHKIIKKYEVLMKTVFNIPKEEEGELEFLILNGGNKDKIKRVKEVMKSSLPQANENNTSIVNFGAEQAAHMGPNGVGFSIYLPLRHFTRKYIK